MSRMEGNQINCGVESNSGPARNEEDVIKQMTLKQIVKIEKINKKSALHFQANILNEVMSEIQADTRVSVVVVCGSSTTKNRVVLERIASCISNRGIEIKISPLADDLRNSPGLGVVSELIWPQDPSGSKLAVILMECQIDCDAYTSREEIEAVLNLSLLISSLFIINCSPFLEEEIFCKLGLMYQLQLSKRRLRNMDYCYNDVFTGKCDRNTKFVKFFQGIAFVMMDTDHTCRGDFLGANATHWRQFILSQLNPDKQQRKISREARKLIKERFDMVDTIYLLPNQACECDRSFNDDVTKSLTTSILAKTLQGTPLSAELLTSFIKALCDAFVPNSWMLNKMEDIESAINAVSRQNNEKYLQNIFKLHSQSLLERPDIFNEKVKKPRFRRKFKSKSVFRTEVEHLLSKCRRLEEVMCETVQINSLSDDWLSSIIETETSNLQLIYKEKRRDYLKGVFQEAVRNAAQVISSTVTHWNHSEYLTASQLKDMLEELKQDIVKYTRELYNKKGILTFEQEYINEIIRFIDMESEMVPRMNEAVRMMYLEKFRSRIEFVIRQLVDDLCEIINSRQYTTLHEYDKVCQEKEQFYKEHFQANETEGIPACVVAELSPHFEILLSSAFSTLKKKYLATTITRSIISPNEIYPLLHIVNTNTGLSRSRINLSFEVDVKEIVVPRLLVDFSSILNDSFTNERIMLELVSLNIFDNLEIDRLLSRFNHETERLVYLRTILQSRNPDDIKACLETFCNLSALPAKSIQFREAFERAFPGCTKQPLAMT